MPRRSWVYTADGRVIEKGTDAHRAYEAEKYSDAPMVFSDEGVFISPIDGLAYSGKAGMREHNRRHDVINNRDLVGLQVGVNPTGKPTVDRRGVREAIIEAARSKGYFEGQ
jgi:hypothetical protein